MGILASLNYDPATAVTNKLTSAGLAMTALDIVNLRATFVVPASGAVTVRMRATVHGGTAIPAMFLGILEGSTVRVRQVPLFGGVATVAASSLLSGEAWATVTGLTPGATLQWDLAYGVETGVGSSAIKYGGPTTGTAADAFGPATLEVWSA